MKLVFAGTPEFARVGLEALIAAGHDPVLVLTQPDRPAGRGMKLQASPVKQVAQARGIPVAQPRSLRLDGRWPDDARAAADLLASVRAEAMVVAAYGLILPQWVLDVFSGPGRHGCLNIHASLLPRWRGAAPIHRAIEAGDTETGVTIMQMDAGLDTGDMLLVRRLPIADRETTGQLHDRLARLGGGAIVDALGAASRGTLARTPQPAEGVTYAHKIDKTEADLDWRADSQVLARRIRAFDPFPGASTTSAGGPLKIWSAQALRESTDLAPGTVAAIDASGVEVACGQGRLRLLELQRPGGRRLAVGPFLAGHPLAPGDRLGSGG